MPKNSIKGKNTRAGSNKAHGRDYSYDKSYESSPARVAYRVELNKANRHMGKPGDGKDISHKRGGGVTLEKASANRSRNGHSKSGRRLK